jgi:glucose/arabinose dehydrogenase
MAIKNRPIPLIIALSLAIIVLLAFSSQAQTISARSATEAPAVTWPAIDTTQIAADLVNPVQVTHAGDGSNRIFIVEQIGRIRIFTNTLVNQPFLDIQDRVWYSGEQGLLGLAFPPDYDSKGYFYVYYTNKDPNSIGYNVGDNVVSRFHLSSSQNQADPNSEEIILPLAHPIRENHNGGQLAFGPDGYLYIGTGDGGGGGDPDENAQDPGSLLGKILRIDVDNTPTPPVTDAHMLYLPITPRDQSGPTSQAAYAIPPDNPFVGQAGYRPEIWALGLRNPWRFSFDRMTSDLYIGDVGQSTREEVDFQPADSSGGENYGWDCREGDLPYEPNNCDPSVVLTEPIYTYATHVNGTCSVTGGFVYRGSIYSSMQGIYFFGDYCQGIVKGLQQETGTWVEQDLLPTGMRLLGFGEDEQGELYIAAVDPTGSVPTGRVLKIDASP